MFATYLAYSMIRPGDRVLDIGGASQPFRRADAVVDIMPYESRVTAPPLLRGMREHFSRESWLVHDMCDHQKPLPYADKEFDFVVCGHFLEDVRAPLVVLQELLRVAKRGYIEVPSRYVEQLRWVEHRKLCGHGHHRWFVDYRKNPETGAGELAFVNKNHLLQVEKKYQLGHRRAAIPSKLFKPRLNVNYEFTGLYFNGPFEFYEDVRAAVSDSHEFMLETVAKAKALGQPLWDREAPIPAKIDLNALSQLKPGLHDLAALAPHITQWAPYGVAQPVEDEILSVAQTARII